MSAEGVGRCGDDAPMSSYALRATQCELSAGHDGWHRGDDGSEWSLRTLAEKNADRDAIARQALADELASMAFATSLGADGHIVRRLASAVLAALDGAS